MSHGTQPMNCIMLCKLKRKGYYFEDLILQHGETMINIRLSQRALIHAGANTDVPFLFLYFGDKPQNALGEF